MAKQARLFLRNGKWTYRVAVPMALREKVGSREIWKSFGAVSYAQARKLARIEDLKTDAVFAAAASAMVEPIARKALTEADILLLAQRYLHGLESGADTMPFDETLRAERLEIAQEAGLNLGLSGILDPALQGLARSVADGAHVGALDAEGMLKITEAVQRALIEHFAREEDRALLRKEGRYDPAFVQIEAGTPPPMPKLTVAHAVELYKAAPERANVASKTRAAYEFRYSVLEELLGPDRSIGSISRSDVRAVQAILMGLPANAKKRFPDLPLRDVPALAAQKGLKPMAAKSATLYIEALSALFNWLEREEMVGRNPATRLKGPALPEETDRRPFTVQELNQLFLAPAFNGEQGRGWKFWLPRVALFSGARFAEILALRKSDVVEEEGVLCLSISANETRRLKTKGSKRLVPVHPMLIDAGFMDHVDALPKDGLLFPDAAGPKDMVTARNKIMGSTLRKLFDDKALVFHSLRHTFKDAATRARVPRDILALLGGWDVPGGRAAIDSYGRDKLIPLLSEQLAKVHFQGLMLNAFSIPSSLPCAR